MFDYEHIAVTILARIKNTNNLNLFLVTAIFFVFCFWFLALFGSNKETINYKLYTGISGAQLSTHQLDISYFPTYISTSWVKDVSLIFMKNNGMLIELDEKCSHKFECCCVSWISKFPDECEILISRSIADDSWTNKAKLTVVDQNSIDAQNIIKQLKKSNKNKVKPKQIQIVKLEAIDEPTVFANEERVEMAHEFFSKPENVVSMSQQVINVGLKHYTCPNWDIDCQGEPCIVHRYFSILYFCTNQKNCTVLT